MASGHRVFYPQQLLLSVITQRQAITKEGRQAGSQQPAKQVDIVYIVCL